MRSLICRAIVKKACSTLDAFLAEVSRKGIPRLSANSYSEEGKEDGPSQLRTSNILDGSSVPDRRALPVQGDSKPPRHAQASEIVRGKRTLATVYSTTFLSSISLLLPTSSLFTPSVA